METLRDLFELSGNFYITIGLTSEFMLYIEGLDEDYVCHQNDFNLDDVCNFMIELNDYKGVLSNAIGSLNELRGISLDTSVSELKERVFDLVIHKSVLFYE